MRYHLRYLSALAIGFFTISLVGCEALGLSRPANQLLPSTKSIRQSAPVPAPIPRELAKQLHPAFIVEPGDTLLVQPVELDAPIHLPPDQTVFPDGTIDLGIYGRPVVAGKTQEIITAEVQSLINAKEKKEQPIAVTVRIIGRTSKVYYVLGEVNAPGAFPITGRETVLDGILTAGGITKRAGEQNVVLSRPTAPNGCRVIYPVCYTNIVQLGDTSTNYQLQPGDRIYVPGRGILDNLPFKRCRRAGGACDRPQIGCWNGECGSGSGCASCGTGNSLNIGIGLEAGTPAAMPAGALPATTPTGIPILPQ